jgi:hypothetical protein
MSTGPTDQQIKTGLNYHGLFFEELVNKELLYRGERGRLMALKEERPFSYRSIHGGSIVAGTADFVGYYYVGDIMHSSSTIFGVECKKVNVAKTWVFSKMKDDPFQTKLDNPNYILKLEINDLGKVSRRSAVRSYISNETLMIKSYEITSSGKVANPGNEEKIFNACRQAVRATNGIFLDEDEVGLELFDRNNQPSRSVNYVPLVITNADLTVLDADVMGIDIKQAEINTTDGLKTEKVGWIYYVFNLHPDERLSLSMQNDQGERFPGSPLRLIVPIVNVGFIDDFLLSFKGYAA